MAVSYTGLPFSICRPRRRPPTTVKLHTTTTTLLTRARNIYTNRNPGDNYYYYGRYEIVNYTRRTDIRPPALIRLLNDDLYIYIYKRVYEARSTIKTLPYIQTHTHSISTPRESCRRKPAPAGVFIFIYYRFLNWPVSREAFFRDGERFGVGNNKKTNKYER